MKQIKLSKTYTVGSETFDRVDLRDPNYADYRQFGPVYEVQKTIVIHNREATFAYADRLVMSPSAGALQTLDLEDAMAIEDEIYGFFVDARISRAKLTNSSSGSTGTPDMSTG